MNYWNWLFKGTKNYPPGIRSYLDWWLIVHVLVGIIGASIFEIKPETAITLSIPFFSALIAITVAVTSNISSLLASKEIIDLSEHHPGKIETYGFLFLNVILVLFITIILWLFSATPIFSKWYIRFFLFLFSSIAVRDCWNIISYTIMLAIARAKIIKYRENKNLSQQEPNSTLK